MSGMVSVFALGLALVAVGVSAATATGKAPHGQNNASSLVFPPNSHPYGKSYGEWTAAFWQYALARPLEGHPFLDTPEYDFAAGQSGRVWFWSAPDSTADGSHLVREVSIPKGTAMFLTIRDAEVSSLEEAPFFGAIEEQQRAGANFFADHIRDVSVMIDGVPVDDTSDFRFETPQFTFTAPTPWIFGDTGGTGTSVGDGYFMMIKPLPVGRHVIEYSGTFHFDAGEMGDEAFDLPHDHPERREVTGPRARFHVTPRRQGRAVRPGR